MKRHYIVGLILVAVAVLVGTIVLFVRSRGQTVSSVDGISSSVNIGQQPDRPEESIDRCGDLSCTGKEDWTSCPNDCPPVSWPESAEAPTSVDLSWQSVMPTRATIEYGFGDWDSLENSTEVESLGMDHSFRFEDLEPNTVYNYRIITKDEAGNVIRVIDNEFRTSAE